MNILTIGAGAYGLALSTILSDKNEVTIYSSIKEEIEYLKNNYKNEKLFPNIEISKKIKFIDKIEKKYDLIVLALPTNIIEQELLKIKNNIKETPILITSKGIYKNKFPYEIVKKIIKTKQIYILSGPSFAIDTIKKQPLTLTIAGNKSIKHIFNEEYINIEETKDIIGTEICGAVKNIYAIGSGILEGINASESTKAAYLVKVINETKQIIKKLNGNEKTVLLSCGVGDTILTCTSATSRNFKLGHMIGKNENIDEYIKTTTVEGIKTLIEMKTIIKITEFNIINTIYDIIYNNEKKESILKA